MEYLRIVNWKNFQHYKDRDPPWIKLHTRILCDYEFSCLQDDSKLLLMLLWVLASKLSNKIPNDIEWLMKQLNIKNVEPQHLIEAGFIECFQDDSKTIAPCQQDAPQSRDREEKSREEKKVTLFPIKGKICGETGCRMPAVYKSEGAYDNYYCAEHMPEKVKEKYQ